MRRFIFVLALASGAYGQTWRGSITGIVSDESQARVPSVKVTLMEEETNRKRAIQADAQGEYTFASLPPGKYVLEIIKENFRKQTTNISSGSE